MAEERKSYKREDIVVEYADKQGLTDFEIGQQVESRQQTLDRRPNDYREGIIVFQKRAKKAGDAAALHVGADGATTDKLGQYRVTRWQRRILAGIRIGDKRIPYTVLAEEKAPRKVRTLGHK